MISLVGTIYLKKKTGLKIKSRETFSYSPLESKLRPNPDHLAQEKCMYVHVCTVANSIRAFNTTCQFQSQLHGPGLFLDLKTPTRDHLPAQPAQYYAVLQQGSLHRG
jgi:hypothetical protein